MFQDGDTQVTQVMADTSKDTPGTEAISRLFTTFFTYNYLSTHSSYKKLFRNLITLFYN